MEEKNKHIDESWKETVQKEKQDVKKDGGFIPPEPDFNFFITTLGLQASIFLGQVPNPVTNKKEQDLKQAKFIIDTLGMLKEKTSGNLTSEESQLLDSLLYELRLHYVSKTDKQTGGNRDDR